MSLKELPRYLGNLLSVLNYKIIVYIFIGLESYIFIGENLAMHMFDVFIMICESDCNTDEPDLSAYPIIL